MNTKRTITAILLACWITNSALATAQENQKPEPDNQVEPVKAESSQVLRDRPFDRFVDLRLLPQALQKSDAELLTDLALMTAYGEKVLGREHKVMSAADLADLALRAAVDANDEDSMHRLALGAKKTGDTQFASKVEVSQKLAGNSRGPNPDSLTIDVMSFNIDDIQAFQDYTRRVKSAKLRSDKSELEQLKSRVEKPTGLHSALAVKIEKLIKDAIDAVGNAPPAIPPNVLEMLAASGRGGAMDQDYDNNGGSYNGGEYNYGGNYDNGGSYNNGGGYDNGGSYDNGAGYDSQYSDNQYGNSGTGAYDDYGQSSDSPNYNQGNQSHERAIYHVMFKDGTDYRSAAQEHESAYGFQAKVMDIIQGYAAKIDAATADRIKSDYRVSAVSIEQTVTTQKFNFGGSGPGGLGIYHPALMARVINAPGGGLKILEMDWNCPLKDDCAVNDVIMEMEGHQLNEALLKRFEGGPSHSIKIKDRYGNLSVIPSLAFPSKVYKAPGASHGNPGNSGSHGGAGGHLPRTGFYKAIRRAYGGFEHPFAAPNGYYWEQTLYESHGQLGFYLRRR